MTDHPLRQRIAAVLDIAPDASRDRVRRAVVHLWSGRRTRPRRIASLVDGRGQVGMLLRNRPAHVAAFLGVLLAGGTVVVINPSRGDERTKDDIAALELPVIIGERRRSGEAGRAGLRIDGAIDFARSTPTPELIDGRRRSRRGQTRCRGADVDQRHHRSAEADRSHLRHAGAQRDGSRAGTVADADRGPKRCRDRQRAAGAHRRRVPGAAMRRRGQAVRAAGPLRPRRVGRRRCAGTGPARCRLVPAALRMVLHSALRREDLDGVRAVTSGTAPLSAEDADAFQEKFGIPVLTSYAATEFGGGVAGWTLADHQKYWQAKRGSVGRANPGAQLRVVDDDGNPLGSGQPGLLEVKPGQLGPSADWMRTTDMARIDEDGFVWILGRADQAIIRGGFKVMPDDVRAALESHPAVAGAAVVGTARRPSRGDARRRGGAEGFRVRRRRRIAGVPAKPAGPLRDSHRDRDRRRHPPDTVGQAGSERHPWR